MIQTVVVVNCGEWTAQEPPSLERDLALAPLSYLIWRGSHDDPSEVPHWDDVAEPDRAQWRRKDTGVGDPKPSRADVIATVLGSLPVRDFSEPGGELDMLRRREAARAIIQALKG
jgi:hypothetical protein